MTMAGIPDHDFAPGHLDRCQVCGSKDLKLVVDLGHQPLCDSLLTTERLNHPEPTFPLRFLVCRSCTAGQIDHVVDGSTVYHPAYPYRSGITRELASHLENLSRDLGKLASLKAGDLVVDIGSNDGTLLKGFKAMGMRVLGVEPTNISEIARADGVDTEKAFFGEDLAKRIAAERGRARLVTATNMFAHMAGLGSTIRGVRAMLADDGLFVLENHYLLDIMKTLQYDSIYHEHLRSYSIRSLIVLFGFYGMSVVDAHRVSSYGGSIRVVVSPKKDLPISAQGSALLAEEADAGLAGDDVWERFAARVAKARVDLLDLAFDCLKKGIPFVGNSCPGRCATLINSTGIDRSMMPYIAEQPTSLKLGLHLPGKHIPVVNNEILARTQPEYVLLLAWHYAAPIAKYLRERGVRSKLVVPLPEVHVLDV
ncbi:MAG: methyltransferase domain-containing protein [Alphaproteobacteria bacterium]|nr:methyltransferase domain-containing protein [Alphaproteobacteria bacterium]